LRRFHEPANHVSFARDTNCDLNADESMLASMTPTDAAEAPLDLPVDGAELATFIAAKLCHDFISPSGAIVSGLDLLKDPSAQDMREDAMGLIEQSARKMVSLVHFARVAFGAATTSERFTARELQGLVTGMTEGGRASLDWRIAEGEFSKPQARALTNLAYLTVGALPMGGNAVVQSRVENGDLFIEGFAEGARAGRRRNRRCRCRRFRDPRPRAPQASRSRQSRRRFQDRCGEDRPAAARHPRCRARVRRRPS